MSAVGDARKRNLGVPTSFREQEVTPMHAACKADLDEAEKRAEHWHDMHRDLVSRLGFGNNITEPMADNDTIVKWFEDRSAEASEWVESQNWRNDCYLDGHPDDEDCPEHDPALRLLNAEATLAAVRTFADELDAGASLRWTSDVAKELRGVLGGGS